MRGYFGRGGEESVEERSLEMFRDVSTKFRESEER